MNVHGFQIKDLKLFCSIADTRLSYNIVALLKKYSQMHICMPAI